MELMVGGARGTMPWTSCAATVYGGDTTAFMISGAEGMRLLIDGGTGLRELQAALEKDPRNHRLLMLFTHYHLDHVMGLLSFGMLYDAAWEIEIAAPEREGMTVAEAVGKLINPPLWPVPLKKMAAQIRFTNLAATPQGKHCSFGAFNVRWCMLHHKDGCSAYRIDEPSTGTSLVIATDVEWALSTPGEREAFLELCRDPVPADALVFDSTYTAENYESFRGWGHSTWEDGVAIAHQTGIGSLLLTHHAQHDDRTLEDRERRIKAVCPIASLLRQGDTIAI